MIASRKLQGYLFLKFNDCPQNPQNYLSSKISCPTVVTTIACRIGVMRLMTSPSLHSVIVSMVYKYTSFGWEFNEKGSKVGKVLTLDWTGIFLIF